jgi:hypothetical protein
MRFFLLVDSQSASFFVPKLWRAAGLAAKCYQIVNGDGVFLLKTGNYIPAFSKNSHAHH